MSFRSIVAVASAWLAAACVASEPAPAMSPADDVGKVLYGRHCLSCHQADGYGVPNLQPAITEGAWVSGDPRALALFVLTGGFDSASRKEGENHNVMPSFSRLSDAEVAAILTFIRGKFGKGASAVNEADVAEARKGMKAEESKGSDR
jgi:mono/diheme cytochrome c family protein